MKIIDLTHTIDENISVYPGTLPPKLENASTHEKDGFKETLLTMYSHTGTHVDAPNHIYNTGKTLDKFEVESFVGKAMIIDIRNFNIDEEIKISDIDMDMFNKVDFILFYSGYDNKFGTEEFFGDYPVLSEELIKLICSSNKKGIGFDVISLDKISNSNLDLHKLFFKNNDIINIENLNNLGLVLEEVENKPFTFVALPMKFRNSDGAPIRAIAMID